MRTMAKGKIHRAHVTGADVNHEGSTTLDPVPMEADILPVEQVHVLDITTGPRLQTYAIEGRRGAGEVVINGAAARMIGEGDLAVVLAYETVSEEDAGSLRPRLVYVDGANRIKRVANERSPEAALA
jgi:aspartate 1-decarboxylase